MKKVIGVFMVMVMVFVFISMAFGEGQHYIFDDVYPFWKELNKEIIDICNDYYLGGDQIFIHDGYYYLAGQELGIAGDYTYDNLIEMEEIVEKVFKEHGIEHVDCHIVQIGKGETMNILYMEINTMTKLREVEDCISTTYIDYDDGSEVYGNRAIFYEHI